MDMARGEIAESGRVGKWFDRNIHNDAIRSHFALTDLCLHATFTVMV
jgi:hypothetical protein